MAAIPGTSANDSDRVHKVSSEAGKAAAGVCQKLPERRKSGPGKYKTHLCLSCGRWTDETRVLS